MSKLEKTLSDLSDKAIRGEIDPATFDKLHAEALSEEAARRTSERTWQEQLGVTAEASEQIQKEFQPNHTIEMEKLTEEDLMIDVIAVRLILDDGSAVQVYSNGRVLHFAADWERDALPPEELRKPNWE